MDGLEKSVVEGSIETIKNCKSVLIELTENKNEKETLTMIESCGFKLDDSMTYKLSKTETNYILRSGT